MIDSEEQQLRERIHRARDKLIPYFGLTLSDIPPELPNVRAMPKMFLRTAEILHRAQYDPSIKEIAMPACIPEGHYFIGHEVGHFLHQWVNPKATVVPYRRFSPLYFLREGVANYVGVIYATGKLPKFKPLFEELLVMGEENASNIVNELITLDMHLNRFLSFGY